MDEQINNILLLKSNSVLKKRKTIFSINNKDSFSSLININNSTNNNNNNNNNRINLNNINNRNNNNINNDNNNNNNNDNNNNNNIRENSSQNQEEPSGRVVFRLSGLAMLGVLIEFLEQIERDEHKVDEKLLKRIPEIKVEDKNKLSEDNKKCTICQEEYNNNDKVIALPCLHFFHTDCIKDWFSGQNTCPNCKFLITKSNVYGQEGIEQTPEESSSKI